MPRSSERLSAGFTLIEMMSVITITAVIAAGVAVFLRMPLNAYQDAQRRAAMTATADTAFTLIKRDLQRALPNSVRVTSVGAVFYLEFLQTRAGGRYRAEAPVPPSGANTCPDANSNGAADENVLEFGMSDACFTTLGAVPTLAAIVPNADFLAVYNLGPGFPDADAYASGAATGGNKTLITAVAAGTGGENVIRFEPHTLTLESPARRFHVISGPVTYACDPGAGTLRRFASYAIAAAQPTPPGGSASLLAQRVTGCSITYDQNAANQRMGVVSMWLRLADPAGGGVVNLFQQVQVMNEP